MMWKHENPAVHMAVVLLNAMSDTHKWMVGTVLGNTGLLDFRSAVAVFRKTSTPNSKN